MRPKITTRRVILAAVALILSATLGIGAAVGYLTFVRSPTNPPAQACGKGAIMKGPVVVAAGASMTQGTLGADWVGALRGREEFDGHQFVNAGINGNTSADLRDRLDTDILPCHPNAVAILIGTNDVRNNVAVQTYRDNLTAIVERLTAATTARVALLSLPPLGEDLDAEINQRLNAYNQAIRDTAIRTGADYLPVHEQFATLLRQREHSGPSYDFSFSLAFRAAAQHYLLRRSWDQVARSHGLELFVDHIHLSDRGGAIVTDLTGGWLKNAAI